MQESWQPTERLEIFIAEAIAATPFAGELGTHCPSLMWSLGGYGESPGKPKVTLPPRYELGLVKLENLPSFRSIPSARFGRLVFHPRPEDEASDRRIIDYDGTDIVVR